MLYPAVRLILNRLWLVQGYFHSNESSQVKLSYDPNGDQLAFQQIEKTDTKERLSRLVTQFNRLSASIGGRLLSRSSILEKTGRGFHFGGSFPMSSNPGPGQTDILGRLWNSKRVHAVDASILPSIPATTITLTVMANAYRIGKEIPGETS